MHRLNNIIPFPNSKSNNTPVESVNKNLSLQINVPFTNIACMESSNPNKLLATAIELHKQIGSIGFLQMAQANQNLFNSIEKIKELEAMSLFFPEISNINPALQEDLFSFIKSKSNMNLFFIFGSSIPFSELKKRSLLTQDFQSLSKKIIQLDTNLIKILDSSY